MQLATVLTRGQAGLNAPPIACEVHLSGGMPRLAIVGLVETAVREARERVTAAIGQSGFEMPDGRIIVNLAPADMPKAGNRFDLAIAVGILAASRQVPSTQLEHLEFYGELAFSGALRPVRGVLPAIMAAHRAQRRCILPLQCRNDTQLLPDTGALLAGHLSSVARYLIDGEPLACPANAAAPDDAAPAPARPDLRDVRGQPRGRRALEVAAAGEHHLLMSGPPGTGKTMLAQRLPGLLPPLAPEQAIENTLINSLSDTAAPNGRHRPFRAPHHTSSAAAIVGGGRYPKPGEISLANHGVLFLDELPEFARNVLEALREPLESGVVTIARAEQTLEFPARFQLVAAMNPCPCGYAGDESRECRCSPDQIQRYRHKISGPLLDRLQVRIIVGRVRPAITGRVTDPGESSAVVRQRVVAAARRQRDRGRPNARLQPNEVRRWCWPDAAGAELLQQAADRFRMSMRACDDALRVARTIADLAGVNAVGRDAVAEALSLRFDPG